MALPDRWLETIESSEKLERPAAFLGELSQRLIKHGKVKDLLSGTWLGHPAHPAIVLLPMGAFAGVLILDFAGGDRSGEARLRLLRVGLVAALPAAATGASDWSDTTGAERKVGLVHSLTNTSMLVSFAASLAARRRGHNGLGRAFSLLGGGLLAVSGHLGGHLAYGQGVGVDTTAFATGPSDWTPVLASVDLQERRPTAVQVEGVGVLLVKSDGEIAALADRCTHRGGPLSEGELRDGCIVCPWHQSAFRLRDGTVVEGPATRAQPRYDVREQDGMIEIKRDEARALRTNPV